MEEELRSRGFQDLILFHQSHNSSVYRASHPGCAQCTPRVAIKVRLLPSHSDFQRVCTETVLLQQVQRHPNIVTLCESFYFRSSDENVRFVVVTEWVGNDLMQDLLHRRDKNYYWSETDFLSLASDVICALAHAEKFNILHGNIQPRHIFYNSITKTAKLGDFSCAHSPFPNVPLDRDRVRLDVYSLGLTLLTVVCSDTALMQAHGEMKDQLAQTMLARLTYSDLVKGIIWEMLTFNSDNVPVFAQFEGKYCSSFSRFPLERPQSVPLQVESQSLWLPPQSQDRFYQLQAFAVGMNHQAKLHQAFQCCGALQRSPPIHLHCSSGNFLPFCQINCYARFMEDSTANYTKKQISCPVCQQTIEEKDIEKAFAGRMTHYMKENYEKGLLCVSCKEVKATDVIECGHLYCQSCLELYNTSIFQRNKCICAACGNISSQIVSRLSPRPSLWRSILCRGN